jgi:cell division protein FtsQ
VSLRTVTLARGVPAAGVAVAGDRRFRRPDVRPVGGRRLARWCWRLGRVLLALAGVAACGYGLAHTVMTSQMFRIQRVTVRGNTRLASAEVEALVQGLRGEHILRADLNAYGERLMDNPWVAAAAMRRLLPGTIEIRILERMPMAIARIASRLYLIDETGIVVDEFGPEYREFDLPVVDGLVRDGTGAQAGVDPPRAALTHEFLAALKSAPALRRRVSQIDVSTAGDVVVLLDNDPTLVHLGNARFAERLRTYEELAPALQSRLQEIDYVDMRFDERIYVKSKGQPVIKKPVGSQ